MTIEHPWRINVMIRHLALRHRHAIQVRLEKELGIHAGQELILLALYRKGPMKQRDLLNYLSIEPPTLSTMATRMEKQGLIVRETNPSDRRAHLLTLTDAGMKMIPTIFGIENAVAEQVTAGMSGEHFDVWLDTMRLALRNLDGEDAHRWTDDLIVTD